MSAAVGEHSLDVLRVEDCVVVGDVHSNLEGGVAVSGRQEVVGNGGQLRTADGAAHTQACQRGGKNEEGGVAVHVRRSE